MTDPERTLAEAARMLTVCNACRYCEGHCAVFPAAARHQTFSVEQLDRLSHLCHSCGACFSHCQYAPPHEFSVNIPAILEDNRQQSYARGSGLDLVSKSPADTVRLTAIVFIVSMMIMLTAALISSPAGLIEPAPSFYSVIPHTVMASLFSAAALLVGLSWFIAFPRAWRAMDMPSVSEISPQSWLTALGRVLSMKNLGGGHDKGCYAVSDAPSPWQRRFHHLVFYGFLLCFLATCLGTVYHYLLDMPAPYGWTSPPKLTGTLGGIGIVAGAAGMLWQRARPNNPAMSRSASGAALIWLLLLVATSGLALPLLRQSPALGLTLIIHLALVLTLFVHFACGKFQHSGLRLMALVADAHEQRGQ